MLLPSSLTDGNPFFAISLRSELIFHVILLSFLFVLNVKNDVIIGKWKLNKLDELCQLLTQITL